MNTHSRRKVWEDPRAAPPQKQHTSHPTFLSLCIVVENCTQLTETRLRTLRATHIRAVYNCSRGRYDRSIGHIYNGTMQRSSARVEARAKNLRQNNDQKNNEHTQERKTVRMTRKQLRLKNVVETKRKHRAQGCPRIVGYLTVCEGDLSKKTAAS